MEKTEFTMKRRALSNICTGFATIAVYLLIQNIWITALMLIVFSLFFAVLFTKNGFTKRFKVLFTVIVLILIGLMCFFRPKPQEEPKVENPPTVIETQPEEEEEQEVIEEDEEKTTSSKPKKNWTYDSLPDKMESSFSNVDGIKDNDSKPNEFGGNGNTEVRGPTTIKVTTESENSKEEIEAAKDAQNKGDDLKELNEGIIAGTTPTEKEEEKPVVKDETTREDPKENKVEEVTQTQPTKDPTIEDQIPLEEQLEEVKDDELNDLFNSTSKEEPKKEEATSQPVHNQPSAQQPTKQPEKVEQQEDEVTVKDEPKQEEEKQDETQTQTKPEEDNKVEEENNSNDVATEVPDEGEKEENKEEIKEEIKEEVKEETKLEEPIINTPVTINPIDGTQAYAGDSVQFKLTGEVKSVNGLDGLEYTVSGGYLTVETNPGEATILSPTVIGADGVSTATASVTVNVINVQ